MLGTDAGRDPNGIDGTSYGTMRRRNMFSSRVA